MIYIKGFIFGLMLQLSVGPVCLAVLHKSIKEGYKEALKMACGVTIVDAFYICISFTTVSSLFNVYFFNKLIHLGGSIALIFFGALYIKNASKDKKHIKDFKVGNSLIYGIKLTLANPLTIIFWASTFGALITSKKLLGGVTILLYSLGCITATLIFLGGISFLGKYISKFFSSKMDYLVGIYLIYFGISTALA